VCLLFVSDVESCINSAGIAMNVEIKFCLRKKVKGKVVYFPQGLTIKKRKPLEMQGLRSI